MRMIFADFSILFIEISPFQMNVSLLIDFKYRANA